MVQDYRDPFFVVHCATGFWSAVVAIATDFVGVIAIVHSSPTDFETFYELFFQLDWLRDSESTIDLVR